MKTKTLERLYLSRTGLVCLTVNAIAFGGCIAFVALGAVNGPTVLLLIGTGLYTVAGLRGVFLARQGKRKMAEPAPRRVPSKATADGEL